MHDHTNYFLLENALRSHDYDNPVSYKLLFMYPTTVVKFGALLKVDDSNLNGRLISVFGIEIVIT